MGNDPYVIEYNCRMGDPETEVVILRLQNDLLALLQDLAAGRLAASQVHTDPRAAATVVLVSGGYPGPYEKGMEVDGLDILREDDVLVFHAGTQEQEQKILTAGGRVLAVSAYGEDIPGAVRRSLRIIDFIEFDGMYFRRDIGHEFL